MVERALVRRRARIQVTQQRQLRCVCMQTSKLSSSSSNVIQCGGKPGFDAYITDRRCTPNTRTLAAMAGESRRSDCHFFDGLIGHLPALGAQRLNSPAEMPIERARYR